jgi:NAD(P)-dependent dehydrogenase (short-subunit alcohol dehydrogenase family)
VAFDATDFMRLARFCDELPTPIDHVLLTRPGPYYAPLAEFDFEKARRSIEAHPFLPMQVARLAAKKVRTGGTLLFIGGAGGRRAAKGLALISAMTAAMPALTKNLALGLAPIRVNLIAAGSVDTPLSASLLGDQLDARREQLRTNLPIRRVVVPADVAALAVHLMTNTAVTGATFDIDAVSSLSKCEVVKPASNYCSVAIVGCWRQRATAQPAASRRRAIDRVALNSGTRCLGPGPG